MSETEQADLLMRQEADPVQAVTGGPNAAQTSLAPRQDTPVATIPESPVSLLSAIVQMARDPSVDVQKLQALLTMQERMEARQAEAEFSRALARLAAIMPRVKKNGTIDLGKGRDGEKRGAIPFARWEDIDTIIRPLLGAEGFTLSFNSEPRAGEGGGLIVIGTLLHRDGHHKTASMPLSLDTGPGRNNLQAMGSTLSYGKRYCAEMLLNIVREGQDDDGKLGGTKFVSETEADELAALMKLTGTEESRFFEMMVSGVRSVTEIEEKDFARLKNALLTKRNQQTKAKGDAK